MRQLIMKAALFAVLMVSSLTGAYAQTQHSPYSPNVLATAEKSGKPYLLDFYASWCSTCRAQDKVLGELQAEDAKYLAIEIIRVDWDDPASKTIIKANKIPRRSTLVIFSGRKELGRVVAQTSKAKIRDLLELGL